MDFSKIYGQLICGIVAADKHSESVTLIFANGGKLVLSLTGDCCSHSYFADISQFGALLGRAITNAEEVANKLTEEDWVSVSWHILRFTTADGIVTIDWRNDSNGWYDGSLKANYEHPATQIQ